MTFNNFIVQLHGRIISENFGGIEQASFGFLRNFTRLSQVTGVQADDLASTLNKKSKVLIKYGIKKKIIFIKIIFSAIEKPEYLYLRSLK